MTLSDFKNHHAPQSDFKQSTMTITEDKIPKVHYSALAPEVKFCIDKIVYQLEVVNNSMELIS